MRLKTSITLPKDLLADIDRRSRRFKSRSEFIEAAVRAYISRIRREERNAKDLQIINANADRLNREVEDVLEYQVIP